MTPGSVLIQVGKTRVLCVASADEETPRWVREGQGGWVTAEYAMLPGSSSERIRRDAYRGGRSLEISRLIGRSLRSVVDLAAIDGLMVRVDCDVVQADGGTRTAAITGAWVALADLFVHLEAEGVLARTPLIDQVAAVSVGIVEGEPLLDLDYTDDVRAEVDMNVVMTGRGLLAEIQGTAEGAPFTRGDLDALLDLAEKGIASLLEAQRRALEPIDG
jgi:ribonuclease PH